MMKIEIIKGYNKTGYLYCDNSYLNNVLHGSQKFYFENGQVHFEHKMYHGSHRGIQKYWFKNGTRFQLLNCKNSMTHGPKVVFEY